MPRVKKTEALPQRNVIILIHGEPGIGKTSLFNTTDGYLYDFDAGIDRSYNRTDALIVDRQLGWQDVLDDEANGTLAEYSGRAIGIDTPKSMLDDFLMAYVIKNDYALAKNQLKAYGAIGKEAQAFYNRVRANKSDIVNMVHSASDKQGDRTVIYPDVTGQTLQFLKRTADQIGYMYMKNGRRMLDFRIQDNVVTKDTAQLGELEVPSVTDPNYKGWLQREVIDKVKERISAMSEAQREALLILEGYYAKIDALEMDDTTIKAILAEVNAVEAEALKQQLRTYLNNHVKNNGWKFFKEEGAFKPATPPATEPEKKEEPEVQTNTKSEVPSPIVMPTPTTVSVVPPAGVTADVEPDLFKTPQQ